MTRALLACALLACALLACALLACALLACSVPAQCIARGADDAYSGDLVYAGQLGAGASSTAANGASPALVTVSDLPEGCTYDAMDFLVSIGGCTLHATLTTALYTRSGFVRSTGDVTPDQTCDVTLASGTARLRVTSGVVAEEAGGALHLELGGDVLQWNAADSGGGHLTLSFDGSR